jgi:hypothetical protein
VGERRGRGRGGKEDDGGDLYMETDKEANRERERER